MGARLEHYLRAWCWRGLMDADTRALLTKFAEIATCIAFGIAVWVLPFDRIINVLLLIVAILSALLWIQLFRQRKQHRRADNLQEQLSAAQLALEEREAESQLAEGMVALHYNLSAEPVSDSEHRFLEIDETYFIQRDDATYKYRMRGVRVVEGIGTSIKLKISGDSPADRISLGLEANDSRSGERLHVDFLRDDDYLKVVEIRFPKPLSTDDEFDITLSLLWSGTFPRARRKDYVFSPWGSFALFGVGRLSFRLDVDADIDSADLDEISDGKRRRACVQPKIQHGRGRRSEISWTVDNPSAIFLLRIVKSI